MDTAIGDFIGAFFSGAGPSMAVALALGAGVGLAAGLLVWFRRNDRTPPAHDPLSAPTWYAPTSLPVQSMTAPPEDLGIAGGARQAFAANNMAETNLDAIPAATFAMIAQIEAARKSRVIAIFHRYTLENQSLSISDMEDVLTAIRKTPPDMPIDIVLHTPGGSSLACTQIARALKAHRGRKTCFVPFIAMSAGTFIALACDEIVMGASACLGPIDDQTVFGDQWVPVAAVIRVAKLKKLEEFSEPFLLLLDNAKQAMIESKEQACELMAGTYTHDGSCAITDRLSSGEWTHGRPITAQEARDMGLRVRTDVPEPIYELARAHRLVRPDRLGPSVWFR